MLKPGSTATGRRPRLLVLASTYPAAADDGTPAFVRDLAQAEAEEFDTVVLVPRVPGAAMREERGGLTVRRFGYFPRRWEDLADGAILENLRGRRSRWLQVVPFVLAEAWALRRAVREFEPDVLHVHWIVPQGVAALLAARKVPWLVTTLGGDVYALSDPVSVRLKRAVLTRAGAVTAMNSDMTDRLVAQGAAPGSTFVQPMGADVDAVRAAGAGVEQIPGRIVFVGRLVEKKGVAVLLEALRKLQTPGWTLEIIGDGPLRAQLTKQAEGLPVTFRGALPRTELARSYAAGEVAVVPSVPAASGDQDGLPVSLMEAMALGCAVVGSRIAGIDAAVVDGESGLLVPPGDVDALAGALDTLLADPDRRAKLGAAARYRAEDYSIAAAGARYRNILRKIVDENK
ncbi:MAG TPA: glycosyltransferase [Mycobacteriales bacterium]|jgi:glycosyltransferase involved in cell wall biosynthesis|nr:glycosyltransferase [Mycobacteriales bacterium]